MGATDRAKRMPGYRDTKLLTKFWTWIVKGFWIVLWTLNSVTRQFGGRIKGLRWLKLNVLPEIEAIFTQDQTWITAIDSTRQFRLCVLKVIRFNCDNKWTTGHVTPTPTEKRSKIVTEDSKHSLPSPKTRNAGLIKRPKPFSPRITTITIENEARNQWSHAIQIWSNLLQQSALLILRCHAYASDVFWCEASPANHYTLRESTLPVCHISEWKPHRTASCASPESVYRAYRKWRTFKPFPCDPL